MRITRLVAGLVTAGLVGLVPLAASAPANAATVGAVTTLTISNTQPVEYGTELSISGGTKGANGEFISTGSTSLQVLLPGAAAYTTIATVTTSPGFVSFDGVVAASNATYKLVFSGGTGGFGSSANTYTASESVPTPVAVQRKVNLKTSGLKVIGKVTPDYDKKKVKILKKVGKKYKKYASVKTNKKGKFVFRAPNRRGFRFIVKIPGDASFTAFANPYRVI